MKIFVTQKIFHKGSKIIVNISRENRKILSHDQFYKEKAKISAHDENFAEK